jgi:hypothetical protein
VLALVSFFGLFGICFGALYYNLFVMTMSCILALEENPEDVYLETTSVLLKVVDNVISNPSNPKYRSIKLGNPTVSSKLLPVVGAMECLFEMGFQEVSTHRDKTVCCIISITSYDIKDESEYMLSQHSSSSH